MENSKQNFKEITNEDKLVLIEKEMPCSGTYRQLDEEANFSDNQIKRMMENFTNSIDWEKRVELERVSPHDVAYSVLGTSSTGNKYGAIGNYSCGELVSIQDLERLNYPERSNCT